MSNKTRFLSSLVAGADTALVVLIVLLLWEVVNPGSVFGQLFAPAKAESYQTESASRAPVVVATAERRNILPTPTIPPEVMQAFASQPVRARGAKDGGGWAEPTWTPIPTSTPAKWTATPKPTATPRPTYNPPPQAALKVAPTATAQATAETIIPAPIPTVTPEPPAPGGQFEGIVPSRLRIPVVGIDAPVEALGLDSAGRPEVPHNYWHVGWIKLGPKPGERGNAVIDGHVDSPTAAAVFYNVRKLKVGDRVYVADESGQEKVFEVFETAVYPYDNAPMDKIFGHSDEARLNLITCTGVFDRASQNYDHRFVAFTRLVAGG